MTTQTQVRSTEEALKLALEFVEANHFGGPDTFDLIIAIKETLSTKCVAQSEQKRPQNCGTSYCSCIECVMDPDYKALWEQMCERCNELDKKLAQLEHLEPVAWIDDYNACKCPDNEARCFSDKVFRMMQKHTSHRKEPEPVAKVCHDLDGHIGWNPKLTQLPDEGTPLYTTPPQRKPLTDDEICKIEKNHLVNFRIPLGGQYDFVRAIEEAHNIKE